MKWMTASCAIALGTFAAAAAGAADGPSMSRPTIAKVCTACHKAEANSLRGNFDTVAFKAKTIQVKLDDAVELVKFDEDDVKVVTAEGKTFDGEALRKIRQGKELKIEYTEKDGVKTAIKIVEKPPIKVAAESLITTAEIEKLVAVGPEKGSYSLFDSRPKPRFQEGAIPTAVNLPFPTFDAMTDKLPADKNRLVIFYCSGVTCSMSPGSAEKAKKLGYTNVKIYREGIPGWSEKHATVLSAQSFKEAWLDKNIPHVLLDVRPMKQKGKEFIAGAVSFPANKAAKLAKELPAADKKPPVIIYDAKEGKQARNVANILIAAGYDNVKILAGGLEAWKSASYATAKGKLAVRAVYVPKPRVGEIALALFNQYAEKLPANVMIIDVRNADEVAKSGTLKTAVNIPEEELAAKTSLIPRDKMIVTLCATGVRAEMAYHALKQLGYQNVSFLNAKTEFSNDGSHVSTKE